VLTTRENRLYSVWTNMKQRCGNPKHPHFADYGGRGITLCAEWLSFAPFSVWALANGWSYDARLTIDRIDNDKGYAPDNCRVVDYATQNRNRRDTVNLTYKGETLCLADWACKVGITRKTLIYRVRSGWPVDKVLTTPPLTRDQWSNRKGHRAGHRENLSC
jgi:hypothetical protein